MSLNWQWNDRMGEAIFKGNHVGHRFPIYQGNAYMICIDSFDEGELYTMCWFAADRTHLRNMLGLTKGCQNVFENFGIKRLRLNTRYKSVPQIVSDLARSHTDIEIELYYEE